MNAARQPIALLAIDLDGTLLTTQRRVSDANVEAISQARGMGVEVVPVSARPPFGMKAVIDRVGLNDFLVAYNGAYVAHQSSGEVLFHRPMAASDAATIVRLTRDHELYVGYYVGMQWYVERVCEEMHFEARGLNATPIIVADLINDAPPQPDKFIVIDLANTDRLERFYQATQSLTPHLNIHYSSSVSIEIGDRAASKGMALEFLSKRLGTPRDRVMAIGDSFNDLSMLEFAGVGIAVGNAPPEVQARADGVVASNDADGVAEAIRQYILGNQTDALPYPLSPE